MGRFSATDAAFEGFRLTRERPLAVLSWAVLLAVVAFVNAGVLVGMAGEAFQRIAQQQPGATPNPERMMSDVMALLPAYGILIVVAVLIYSVLYVAVNRAVLRPQEGGVTLLRFGADELRQIGLGVLLVLLLGGAYLVFAIVIAVLIGIGAGISAAGSSGAAGVVTGILALIVGIAGVCAFVWVAVRLSLASPLTFDRRRIDVFGSWKLTRGRFWPLFGAYLLAWVMTLLIYLLAFVIMAAVGAAVGGGMDGLQQLFRPNYASLGAFFTPVVIVNQLLSAVVGAMVLAISAGAPAHAYRQIVDSGAASTFA